MGARGDVGGLGGMGNMGGIITTLADNLTDVCPLA
jgi:hypothetical protein